MNTKNIFISHSWNHSEHNDFSPPKAVIAVRPYGAERTSVFATENADETVNWNADSIVAAIRRLTR